jgi:4-amino-4-deoxy-L-arabinose transferase-like glycosyltransferase
MRRFVAIAVLLTLAAFGFRLFLALRFPNDDDDDGRFYSQIARNLLDHRGYSGEEEEPYVPTYVRVPGYPLFLAGVYAVFGLDNNRAVRVIQAALDTATSWLIALLAYAWSPAEWQVRRRRRAMLIALALAAACPFTAVYVTTILTETWAILLTAAFSLAATLALKTARRGKALLWWLAAGLLGGAVTMFRPDCALFVGGVGVMLASTALARAGIQQPRKGAGHALGKTFLNCAALSIAFAAVLAPWTIRNARLFGVFQPVAPRLATDPGKSAPVGYVAWLSTWVDDERYVGPIEDGLDLYPIQIERIPDYAFDSDQERGRVQTLFDRYNNPEKPSAAAYAEEVSESDPEPAVKMTAEIDGQFGEIARERIARHPLRQYVLLPLKRVASMWFDTHSQYYQFQGELFPLYDLDTDAGQQYWLSLFATLTWFYTIVGLAGVWLLVRANSARRWALLLALLILPRLAFLSFQEHPEARYTVEFFALVAAAAAIALARVINRTPKAV